MTAKRDRAWFVQFLQNPKAVIEGGDPYALELKEEARGVIMPTIAGMTPERVEALLDLIAAESAEKHSQFEGLKISDEPFTPAQIARGRDLTGVSSAPAS